MAEDQAVILNTYVTDRIPVSVACTSALALVRNSVVPPILNHSLRVYLIAVWLAQREKSEWAGGEKQDLLFVATVCHDLGAGDRYNGQQRFEVEGADAAKQHLISHGYSEADAHQVWTAIAVHTSPGIAEQIELHLPRLGVERALGDAVVKQAVKIPDSVDSLTWPNSEKHPSASWPGILLRAHIENADYDGINPAF
ncbi:hypothetical protein S40288_03288 [Stachybotrys chartarum IBT 40288]|nr:hypothetical protein S40288_03288 [Stachybotrys chartarum IBT 40288]